MDGTHADGSEQLGRPERACVGEQVHQVSATDPERNRHRDRSPHGPGRGGHDESRRGTAEQPVGGSAMPGQRPEIVNCERIKPRASAATTLQRSRRVRRWIRAPSWSMSGSREPSSEAPTALTATSVRIPRRRRPRELWRHRGLRGSRFSRHDFAGVSGRQIALRVVLMAA